MYDVLNTPIRQQFIIRDEVNKLKEIIKLHGSQKLYTRPLKLRIGLGHKPHPYLYDGHSRVLLLMGIYQVGLQPNRPTSQFILLRK